MGLQEGGVVPVRRLRLGMTVAACASSLLVMGILLGTTVRTNHVKRIAELESRQLSLYQALAGKDQLFQNERRTYVERIKRRDELLRQREQTIMVLRSRLDGQAERAEGLVPSAARLPLATGEPIGFTAQTSASQLQGSIVGR